MDLVSWSRVCTTLYCNKLEGFEFNQHIAKLLVVATQICHRFGLWLSIPLENIAPRFFCFSTSFEVKTDGYGQVFGFFFLLLLLLLFRKEAQSRR